MTHAAGPAQGEDARPGRQGHHVRLGRSVAQDRRGDDDDEDATCPAPPPCSAPCRSSPTLGSVVRGDRHPLPLTENMPGRRRHPCRVTCFAARNGKTVEVLNTDAEGRLILADGLSLAVEAECRRHRRPRHAHRCVHRRARARTIAGADGQRRRACRAGARQPPTRAGEKTWPLPLPAELPQATSTREIADMKNIGGRATAARSTRRAVPAGVRRRHVPWVHLDIAGPAPCRRR